MSRLSAEQTNKVDRLDYDDIRLGCVGEVPLDAVLERWMLECFDTDRLQKAIAEFGSPINVIAVEPMERNAKQIQQAARDRNVDLRIFFARKSNKCLGFVEKASELGLGVDTASENELQQCIDLGIVASDLICTAAIKTESLITMCVKAGVCVAVDNSDELQVTSRIAAEIRRKALVAIRIGGFHHDGQKLPTRFGFDADCSEQVIESLSSLFVEVNGIHFHLDGYDGPQRVSGIAQSLRWIDRLRRLGHATTFVDMGGGFPISYLSHGDQWDKFWIEHRRSLLEQRTPITYRNHGLGRSVYNGQLIGEPKSYPYFQSPTREAWFAAVLDAKIDGETVADRLVRSDVQLRCEPGRALMDGCGITAARVEFRKQNADGDWLIGLSMNRTQCRTSSDDFLVDPILVPVSDEQVGEMSGYLVGAYCTESELLSLRRLKFPQGVRRGDIVVFPNTAGYLMHFLESRSHQFPLAGNLVASSSDKSWILDQIDADD